MRYPAAPDTDFLLTTKREYLSYYRYVLTRVAATISRHGLFQARQRVGVGVSGGADSVCLLHVLAELAPKWNLTLSVLHLNHTLRDKESDADEEFVRGLAARFDFEFHCKKVDVRRLARETRDNLEQAARRVRREFFLDFVSRGALDRVALGHTRSDQAETVLFRFLRGAGTTGLAGMRPLTPEGLVRPLLEICRPEIHEYLLDRRIPWREDASNADRSFARNRIRLDLLPALTRDWNPALPETLSGVARIARDEEDYWNAELDRVVSGRFVEQSRAILFRTDWFRELPRAIARRVVRRAIEAAKGDLRAIDLLHVEGILELADAAEGSARLQVPGLDVFRSFDWVRLAPPGMETIENRDYEVETGVPGRLELPHSDEVLSLDLVEAAQPAREASTPASAYNDIEGSELDWGRISGGLRVRNWRPGDHYRPVGHARDDKIKTLFQQARVPLWERRRWPVITCQDSIVWAAKFGPAAEYAADPRTRTILRVRKFGRTAEF